MQVLRELGLSQERLEAGVVEVWNKADLLEQDVRDHLRLQLVDEKHDDATRRSGGDATCSASCCPANGGESQHADAGTAKPCGTRLWSTDHALAQEMNQLGAEGREDGGDPSPTDDGLSSKSGAVVADSSMIPEPRDSVSVSTPFDGSMTLPTMPAPDEDLAQDSRFETPMAASSSGAPVEQEVAAHALLSEAIGQKAEKVSELSSGSQKIPVVVSACTGYGLDTLKRQIDETLRSRMAV